MNAAGRLTAYGAGLAVAFTGAFAVAGAVVPDDAADQTAQARQEVEGERMDDHAAAGQEHPGQAPAVEDVRGLAIAQDGFLLTPVRSPGAVGEAGDLSFQVQDAAGEPVVDYRTAHDKDLHLIVVRADGSGYRHVHPRLDPSTGTWSIPWRWAEAGTYRVFVDFVPATGDDEKNVTLSRTVQVAGDVAPTTPEPTATDEVDGFTVDVSGELTAGSTSELTVSVRRDGEPVTTLEPYLGAFGHLVALREGDLAYLHVHAAGDEPAEGDTAGPEIGFAATAPTPGRYLLYLDFQVDGKVRTAELVLDAGAAHGTPDTSDHGH
ncbi:heavy-metal-associated domain-containing protein [Isoptericola cucumis]|uniref:heavy-metal-associated domain-containing protein n=1 Tax=Isoptericola cucumis TaxID=1776856 RepID=UPI003209FC62